MKNDIVRLVSSALQMNPWQARERVKEEELLIEIEYVTDKETSETIRDICMPEKNGYTFYQYLRKLNTVLEAISMGIPIDEILKVIDNRVANETIETIIEKYRLKSLDTVADRLSDFKEEQLNGYRF